MPTLKKDYMIEKYLREQGLEMRDVHMFRINLPANATTEEEEDEILHRGLTSYIRIHAGNTTRLSLADSSFLKIYIHILVFKIIHL